ncbi:MAG: 4-deoxy-L-threo-5-hexosulose-uronate ketol-isomerase [Lentisphaerae bacterium ADurb.BinA184]|nr:MAG: 4-deoxy-L-threo-5-hexosulose-uronate ketol-isomerase [Lentisphaerae bacterium ADurb.BinA184]
MQIQENSFPALVAGMPPEVLRREFLVTGLFVPGELHLRWWETDRTVVGGICPTTTALTLPNPAELRATNFFERREAGLLNIGGPGIVAIDGKEHRLERYDALYVGRGAYASVTFRSVDPAKPARFYLLSYPAHTAYPICHVAFASVEGNRLGSAATANDRTIRRLIHPGTCKTCQLVMGVTTLATGSVWNTMPAHTHSRRSEVYLYFDIPADQAVFHFMGRPQETRHLVIRDGEVALSPVWSIHSGVGTASYSFCWGMGGENQDYGDMDPAPIATLR